MGKLIDAVERHHGVFVRGGAALHNLCHCFLQPIHPRIGMIPSVREGGFVEVSSVWECRGEFRQPGARWNQQPDRILHWIHVFDQIVRPDKLQKEVASS